MSFNIQDSTCSKLNYLIFVPKFLQLTTFLISVNDNPIYLSSCSYQKLGTILNISPQLSKYHWLGSISKYIQNYILLITVVATRLVLTPNLLFGHCRRLCSKLHHEPQLFIPLVMHFAPRPLKLKKENFPKP